MVGGGSGAPRARSAFPQLSLAMRREIRKMCAHTGGRLSIEHFKDQEVVDVLKVGSQGW